MCTVEYVEYRFGIVQRSLGLIHLARPKLYAHGLVTPCFLPTQLCEISQFHSYEMSKAVEFRLLSSIKFLFSWPNRFLIGNYIINIYLKYSSN